MLKVYLRFAVFHFVVKHQATEKTNSWAHNASNRIHLWHSKRKRANQPNYLLNTLSLHRHSHFAIEQTIPLAGGESLWKNRCFFFFFYYWKLARNVLSLNRLFEGQGLSALPQICFVVVSHVVIYILTKCYVIMLNDAVLI